MFEIYMKGLLLSGGLIIAIGSQNAFLLGQSLRREHHILAASICAVSDVFLIFAGVMGLGALIQGQPLLLSIARWGGAAYLILFGFMSLRKVFHTEQLVAEKALKASWQKVALATLAVTYLNPHVYLDTMILLGGIGAQYGEQRWLFVVGAATASLIWFYGLTFGAAKLAPLVSSPRVWKVIDLLVCVAMWLVAASLILN
ncbi:hypothetical protein EOPP23_08045 [Endozoicomonas sp. OPT23]|uniref:LysE/ArgO family amino acid transporter n=1 Tax=Endozoicomonas sp. OPT23 TaxID=2072845 RepID=UPI00129B0E65|nr:LysE/ArgO family amino acid transporter [Endozoicomonas sp. OPT23]MRI32934.1 hypothetical protein [Endozoicomonas sp. OPT23]